jgi:hypothetical protein
MSIENLDQATLIQAAIDKKTPLMSDQHVPNVTIMFDHFAKMAGIASPQQLAELDMPQGDSWKLFRDLWESWAKAHNYEQKKQIFKERGFKVIGLFADLNKMSDFLEKSHLDDQFVTQQKNLITIDVDNSSLYGDEQHIIFVLEYPLNQDPLAAKTVDYDEVRTYLNMDHELAKVLNIKNHETIVDKFMKNYKK